jgi:hypothetical protein
MGTITSSIGQMSDEMSRLILPKDFYDLRHAIPNIVVSITYWEKRPISSLSSSKSGCYAMKQISNVKFKTPIRKRSPKSDESANR